MTQRSSPQQKVELFRAFFRGRDDVYALRWESGRTNKSGWGPAVKGGWANSRRPDRELLVLSDEVVADHLVGRISVGLYPLLGDDTCCLLACDFDGGGWTLDALAYLDAARAAGIPAALERSRSGDGGHVWVFFSDRVPASSARRIGAYLVREAMTTRRGARPHELRPAVPSTGFPAQTRVRQPHCPSAPGRVPQQGNDRLPRPVDA